MTASDALIRNIGTGVPGLDAVLGGGLCEYSFNLIAGAPGVGKTTLAQQILFANATPERPALYFTVLGEPTIKMLRYQRQFGFFDPARVPSAVRFINLAAEAARRRPRRGAAPHRCRSRRRDAGVRRGRFVSHDRRRPATGARPTARSSWRASSTGSRSSSRPGKSRRS